MTRFDQNSFYAVGILFNGYVDQSNKKQNMVKIYTMFCSWFIGDLNILCITFVILKRRSC